jgi:tRNA/rRNA methyltransferase
VVGTDSIRREETSPRPAGPAIILIDSQLGENIGMAARAMANCGLSDLRLVRPREGWPNEKAVAAASGASGVLDAARVFETTADAIADLCRVFAATARGRDMIKPVLTPRQAAEKLAADGRVRAGVLFGPERSGLVNDDLALADAVIVAPLNPGFWSLNLAQAVLLVGYEWFLAAGGEGAGAAPSLPPASREELLGFFEHLESELDVCGFLKPPEKRPVTVRSLRNLFLRAALTEQEVRMLRGVVSGLVRFGGGRGPDHRKPFDRGEAAGIVRAAAGTPPASSGQRRRDTKEP